jgi:phage baseplate assembly protein W
MKIMNALRAMRQASREYEPRITIGTVIGTIAVVTALVLWR